MRVLRAAGLASFASSKASETTRPSRVHYHTLHLQGFVDALLEFFQCPRCLIRGKV